MIKSALIISIVVLSTPVATTAQGLLDFQLDNRAPERTSLDNRDLLRRGGSAPGLLQNYFTRQLTGKTTGMYLSTNTARFYGYHQVELTRLGTMVKGAETAASMALFLGAVGNTFGLFDEKTSWWMMGGAAALGALYGGTAGYEDPGWRYQIRWDDD